MGLGCVSWGLLARVWVWGRDRSRGRGIGIGHAVARVWARGGGDGCGRWMWCGGGWERGGESSSIHLGVVMMLA